VAAKNSARRQKHKEAEERRSFLLDAELHDCQRRVDGAIRRERLIRSYEKAFDGFDGRRPELDISHVRSELQTLGAAISDQPAAGPVLLGVAALLYAQSTSEAGQRLCWVVERAAFLNGGDDFVRGFVPFLSSMMLRPTIDVEGGGGDTITITVEDGVWTAGELRALAALLTRLAARQPIGRHPTGRVEPSRGSALVWKPRPTQSWHEWIVAFLGAWRARLWPL